MKKRKMIMRCVCFALAGIMLFSLIAVCLTGCSRQESPNEVDPTTEPTENVITAGDKFQKSGFKIKAVLTPQTVATLDALTFEVYVDSKGNGNGLVGYKDGVYDVLISSDKVYVTVGKNTVINLSTITGHMIPSTLSLTGVSDLTSNGFSVLNDSVVGYKADVDSILYDVVYSSNDTIFDAVSVSAGNSMTLTDMVSFILDYEASLSSEAPTEEAETPEKDSFYNREDDGVTIHNEIYSIGDYCNPTTYFEGIQPSGLVPEYKYNQDDRIEFMHISYLSSDGQTKFVTTQGYVQTIDTTSPFTFLGMSTGDSYADISAKLGIRLKKDEIDSFKPIRKGLTVVSSSNKSVELSYNGSRINLYFDKTGLYAITVTNLIDFVEEGH